MSPDDEVALWLELARADLAVARQGSDEDESLVTGIRCYHCQQAAEKAFKAVIARYGNDVPRIHALNDLRSLARDHVDVPDVSDRWMRLNAFIVATRYPDLLVETSREDLAKSIVLAEECVAWAAEVAGRGE